MTKQSTCAHCCDDCGFPGSLDYARRVRCPACGLLICRSCRATSTPTDCMHAGDDTALMHISTIVPSVMRGILDRGRA